MTLRYYKKNNKWVGNEQGKGWPSNNDDEERLVLWPWSVTEKPTNEQEMNKAKADEDRTMMKNIWFITLKYYRNFGFITLKYNRKTNKCVRNEEVRGRPS